MLFDFPNIYPKDIVITGTMILISSKFRGVLSMQDRSVAINAKRSKMPHNNKALYIATFDVFVPRNLPIIPLSICFETVTLSIKFFCISELKPEKLSELMRLERLSAICLGDVCF